MRALNGRYRLDERVGHGGMAAVYRAHDEVLGREVAVKILHPAGAADPTFVERLRREAQAAARLTHPNVVTIYDWGRTEDVDGEPSYYIVMEYVPGETLADRIAREGPLPEPEALRIGQQVAEALHAAHRRGIIHRDVKPQNVLLDPAGRVKVVDFGIAHAQEMPSLTSTSEVSGTPYYLAPEAARGEGSDVRSDVYSLGVLLYEMLTGKVPFTGESLVEIALHHAQTSPTPVGHVRRVISHVTDAIVMKALDKDPGRRYGTAAELAQALAWSRELAASRSAGKADETVRVRATPGTADRPAVRQGRERPVIRAPQERTRRSGPAWARIIALPLVLLLFAAGAAAHALSAGSGGRPTHHLAARAHHTATPTPTRAGARRGLRPTVTPTSSSSSAPVLQAVTATPQQAAAPAPTVTAHVALAPAPTPVPPATGAGSPTAAVAEFYQLVNQGAYGRAAQLWTPSMQLAYSPYQGINVRFGRTSRLILRRDSVVSTDPHNGSATVAIDLLEQMDNGSTRTWSGTWTVQQGPGGWLLQAPNLSPAAGSSLVQGNKGGTGGRQSGGNVAPAHGDQGNSQDNKAVHGEG